MNTAWSTSRSSATKMRLPVTRAPNSRWIAPRFEEILELTLAALPQSGAARRAIRRAVLTGGGSLIVGARESAERIIGVKTRLGRPAPLAGAPETATAPQFSVAVGVIQAAARQRAPSGRTAQRRRAASGGAMPGARALGGVFGNVGAWLRSNF